MSKYLCMGVPFEDVIRRSTVNPARIINHPELGTLSQGAAADIAVLTVLDGIFCYDDAGGATITGEKQIKNVFTLFGGNIVFDPYGFSKLPWKEMPEDSQYWINFNDQKW